MIEAMLLAGAAGASAFVAAELIARSVLVRRGATFVHRPHSRSTFELSAEALPEMPTTVRFAANADGERGDPVPTNPEGTMRVLVAGGSAAECYLLDQGATWPALLQERLGALPGATRPVHVGNVARSLIACRQIDALLTRALPRFKGLDVVVLMVGASDLVSWLEAGTPPEVTRGDVDVRKHSAEHPLGPFGWSPKQTALYRVVRRLAARFQGEPPVRRDVGASLVKHRAMRAAATTLVREVPDPSPMLEAFERDLRALVATCRAHAPRVVVARQPWLDRNFSKAELGCLWNFGQGSPYRGDLDTYYDIDVVRELMRQVDAVAARVARETGSAQVDLRTAVPSDFEHYYDFLHFTPEGARTVAEALTDAVAGRPLATPPEVTGEGPLRSAG